LKYEKRGGGGGGGNGGGVTATEFSCENVVKSVPAEMRFFRLPILFASTECERAVL